jgi:hypothetical protein
MDHQAQPEIPTRYEQASGEDYAASFAEDLELANVWSPLVDPWWSWGFGGGLFKVRDPGP